MTLLNRLNGWQRLWLVIAACIVTYGTIVKPLTVCSAGIFLRFSPQPWNVISRTRIAERTKQESFRSSGSLPIVREGGVGTSTPAAVTTRLIQCHTRSTFTTRKALKITQIV
jgi:hypothetical protein